LNITILQQESKVSHSSEILGTI